MSTKYDKDSFLLVPNKKHLAEKKTHVQCVYFWICNYIDDEKMCFPSRTTLARVAGCSVQSVDRAIEELCECGLLKKTNRVKENHKLTNLYQIMLLEGGTTPQVVPSPPQVVGVAPQGRIELNPVLTQSTEESVSLGNESASYEILPEEGESKPIKARRDKQAFALKSICYDHIEKEYGIRPTDTFADYLCILNAQKRLKDGDILVIVDDALSIGKAKTLREMLTARQVDIYLQQTV